MLRRIFPPAAILLLLCFTSAQSVEKDHLARGERDSHETWEDSYFRSIHYVLARAWRKDVVLRMLDIPPFQPEWASGISRSPQAYRAFSLTASNHIWSVMLGDAKGIKKGDYHKVRVRLHEKDLPEDLSTRITVLWHRFLTEPKNFRKDPGLYLDTDQFSFYIGFLPRENISAHMTGWGEKGFQLINVAAFVGAYAEDRANERELSEALA